MEEIVKKVCEFHGVDFNEFKMHSRKMNIIRAKHQAIYLLREFTPWPLHRIGSLFDLDHSTVIHALKSVKDQCDTDLYYAREVQMLTEIINPKPVPERVEVWAENDYIQ